MREIEYLWLFAACFPVAAFIAFVWVVDYVDNKNRKVGNKKEEA